MLIASTLNDFYLHPQALNITLNAMGDYNTVSASVYAGAKVMVWKQGIEGDALGYNPDNGRKQWTLEAYPTRFTMLPEEGDPDKDVTVKVFSSSPRYVHIAIQRSGTRAVVVYSPQRLDIYGRYISEDAKNFIGRGANNEWVVLDYEPSTAGDNFYLFLGKINAATRAKAEDPYTRSWSNGKFETGNLDTNRYIDEKGSEELTRMFELDEANHQIEQKLPIRKSEIYELWIGKPLKKIVNLWRTLTDKSSGEDPDEVIPSVGYVQEYAISKWEDDTVHGYLTFENGFNSKGPVVVEDNMTVTGTLHVTKLEADNVEVMEAKHIGGKVVSSPAGAELVKVENVSEQMELKAYRCWFRNKDENDNPVHNMFVADDLVQCQQFQVDASANYIESKFYWLKCIGVGSDEEKGNYIDLEASLSMGNDKPTSGDHVFTMGNTSVVERQNAIIMSPVGTFIYKGRQYKAPYMIYYRGINSKKLPDPYRVDSADINIINANEVNITTGNETTNVGDALAESFQIHTVDWAADTTPDKDNVEIPQAWYDWDVKEPSMDWTDEELNNNLGDFLVTTNGYTYRFVYDEAHGERDPYGWQWIQDAVFENIIRQQSGFVTKGSYGELWSAAWDGITNEQLARAGVITSTSFNAAADKWWSTVEIYGNDIKLDASHAINFTAGTFTVDTDNFKLDSDGNVSVHGKVEATEGYFAGSLRINFVKSLAADVYDYLEYEYTIGGNIYSPDIHNKYTLPVNANSIGRRVIIYNPYYYVTRAGEFPYWCFIRCSMDGKFYDSTPVPCPSGGVAPVNPTTGTLIQFRGGIVELLCVPTGDETMPAAWIVVNKKCLEFSLTNN